MSSLDFLKSIKVDATPVKKTGGGGMRKDWNPTGLAIRVWKDGSVLPSEELTDRFQLEYRPKGSATQGNALDVFPSSQAPFFKTPQPLIIINVVDKEKPKTDLFDSVGYYAIGEDFPEGASVGDPVKSVLDQGSSTFGSKVLLPMIKEVYGIEPNEKGFIDLIVLGVDGEEATESFPLPAEKNDMCHIPKPITRGDKKGLGSYVKREYPKLYVLYPETLAHPAEGGKEPE